MLFRAHLSDNRILVLPRSLRAEHISDNLQGNLNQNVNKKIVFLLGIILNKDLVTLSCNL
jgi:hypothetical protein